jgi:hypothetical protein
MDYITKKVTPPKLTVTRAINKFLISWDIKLPNNVKTDVFYSWDKKKKPIWLSTEYPDKLSIPDKPTNPYIGVDYDKYKKIWYINYVINEDHIYYASIDDTTGSVEIYSTFDK